MQYVRNHYKDDPDIDKDIRDIKDRPVVPNLKGRLDTTQKQYKQKVAGANAKDKTELSQRLSRIKNISQAMLDDADAFVKKHKDHIRVPPQTGLKLSPEAQADYEQLLRKSRGFSSDLKDSLLNKR